MRLMKTRMVKAARVILCLAALVVTYGCTTPQNSVTGKSWSQTAAEEERDKNSGRRRKMIGTCCLKLAQVVLCKSCVEQKVPFNNLVLVPDRQKHCK